MTPFSSMPPDTSRPCARIASRLPDCANTASVVACVAYGARTLFRTGSGRTEIIAESVSARGRPVRYTVRASSSWASHSASGATVTRHETLNPCDGATLDRAVGPSASTVQPNGATSRMATSVAGWLLQFANRVVTSIAWPVAASATGLTSVTTGSDWTWCATFTAARTESPAGRTGYGLCRRVQASSQANQSIAVGARCSDSAAASEPKYVAQRAR